MRLATYRLDGQRQVGLVSNDGRDLTPLALSKDAASRGVQAIIDLLAAGDLPPATHTGKRIDVAGVQLEAPIPTPRRNLWCVGRNYHAHANELKTSVFKDNDVDPESWPIVFTKVPECVIGPHD